MTASRLVPRRAGLGLRLPHLMEVVATRPSVEWFEIHPENFLASPHATELLFEITKYYRISVHSVGLSIGSVAGVDRVHMKRVRALVDAVTPSSYLVISRGPRTRAIT